MTLTLNPLKASEPHFFVPPVGKTWKMHPSIQLQSGRYFDFTDPFATLLLIEDISAGLSRICRFTGHLKRGVVGIYSVGQHSVLASENTAGDPYEALMHDRTESVMTDISSPLKQLLPDYRKLEHEVEEATAQMFNLPHPMTQTCKDIDLRMLATEKRDMMPGDADGEYWALLDGIEPLPFKIVPWSPEETNARFLHRYNYLRYGIVPDKFEPYAKPHEHAPADYKAACLREWGSYPTAFSILVNKVVRYVATKVKLTW